MPAFSWTGRLTHARCAPVELDASDFDACSCKTIEDERLAILDCLGSADAQEMTCDVFQSHIGTL